MSDQEVKEIPVCRVSRPVFSIMQGMTDGISSSKLIARINMDDGWGACSDWIVEHGIQTIKIRMPHLRDATPAHEEALAWFRDPKNKKRFLNGLLAGFAIKRYRTALEYSDGTRVVIRESEFQSVLTDYTEKLTATYRASGYVLKQNADGSIGLYRKDGVTKHCDVRVSLVKDGATPHREQRDPPIGTGDIDPAEDTQKV